MTTATQTTEDDLECDATVPMVRVRLVQSVRLPPHQSVLSQVRIEDDWLSSDPLLLQYDSSTEQTTGVCVGDALIQPSKDSDTRVLLTNMTGFTRRLEEGDFLGRAVQAAVVCAAGVETSRAFTVTAEAPREGTSDRG